MTVRVSVIIPTYNRPDMPQRMLSSVALQSLPADAFEVLVVDDGSDEPPMLSNGTDLPSRLSVLRQVHQGPTVARNLGARESRGAVLVFLDDERADTVALPTEMVTPRHRFEHRPPANLLAQSIPRIAPRR